MADTSSSSSAIPLDASWSKTEFKVVKFSHVWTIENYSFCTKGVGEYLDSPTFSADPNDQQQPKWQLKLFPKGKKEEFEDYVALFLNLDEHNRATESVSAKFKFAILKANGEQTNVWGPDEEAVKFEQEDDDGWGYFVFIRRSFLFDPKNGLLPNDQLTIFCEVSTVVDKENRNRLRILELERKMEQANRALLREQQRNAASQTAKDSRMLNCAVCLDRYVEPRQLPCGHSYCTACLEGLRFALGGYIKCPMPGCGAKCTTTLVKNLPLNITLQAAMFKSGR